MTDGDEGVDDPDGTDRRASEVDADAVRVLETTAGRWLAVHGPSGATATGDTRTAARRALEDATTLRGDAVEGPPAERHRVEDDGDAQE